MKTVIFLFVFAMGTVTAFSQTEKSKTYKRISKKEMVLRRSGPKELKTKTMRIMPKSKIDTSRIVHPMQSQHSNTTHTTRSKAITDKKKKTY